MPTYGRHHSLPRPDWGFIAPGQMRGSTFNAPSQHLWAYEFGIWGGRYTTNDPDNVTARVAVYRVDGNLAPTSRIGYSAAMTVTAAMTSQSGGAENTAAVEESTGPDDGAIPLVAGTPYHLAVLGTVGSLAHGMAAASRISAVNEKFYNRTGLSQPPPDPFGTYTSSTEGHVTIWAECDVNVAPDVPTSLSPAGIITETAPTFTAAFSDDNENRGDHLTQYRIQVRRQGDGVTFWNATFMSSGAEQAADAIARAYGGTTLVRGTAYEWRCQMADYFGTWSAWSAWTAFTPASTGVVTLDGAPTGKIESVTPSFAGKWTHADSEAMTHVQVRILSGFGLLGSAIVLQTGAEYDIANVSSSAAPGTAFTVPWANAGLNTLAWGSPYQYQIRGKDASGIWSGWSAARTFSPNAAPSVPSNLQPNSTFLPSSSYPLLTCSATDSDDTVATGLEVFAWLRDDEGTTIDAALEMTYNADDDRWEYQTSDTEITADGIYRWDAYSYDGTLYSGEKTSFLEATRSDEAAFWYAEGPEVTVTSPTVDQVLTSSALTVTWSVSGGDQGAYAVRVYDSDGVLVIEEEGSTATTVTIEDSPQIRNGRDYTVVVQIVTGALVSGYSDPIPFSVSYTPPATVQNLQLDTFKVGTDIWASAVRLTWDQSEDPDFQFYTIQRTAASGPDKGTILLTRLTSASHTTFTDYAPASGHEYTYSVTQSALEGVDSVVSEPATATTTLALGGVVLASVLDPEGLRTCLRYTAERDYPRRIEETVYQPLSGQKPRTVRSRARAKEPTFDARLFDDVAASAAARRDELEAIDEDGGTYCYRDNHGRKLFVTLPEITPTDMVPDWYIVRIQAREEHYQEGLAALVIEAIEALL